MRAGFITCALVIAGAAACGDNIKLAPDANTTPQAVCGNNEVEPGEDCDDGGTITDMVCDAACHFTCGNGALDVDFGELCDPGITSGPGACPTTCDDAMSCTADVLSGSGCTATCLHSDITVASDDDGCCPPTENATTDNDCAPVCGNLVVEPGELCDIAIPAGAGACPATCDDGQLCTTDALVDAGTCQAACTFTDITLPIDNDMCCPPGATPATDNDCLPDCGNGVFEPGLGETCDIGIPTGPGSCPTACADADVCTTDTLLNPGTCTAACAFVAIVNPINNDGCCPPGANANNDNDCAPVCPNGVQELGEQCDDGNLIDTDGCTNACTLPPTAFRFSDLDLRDPHAFAQVTIFCIDITGNLNTEIQTSITTDGDSPLDGLLDLSPVLVFRPLNQGGVSTPLELHFADCTTPLATTQCTAAGPPAVTATATNQAAMTCLGPIAGTTGGTMPTTTYSPAITSSTPPCFSSNAVTVTVDLGGIPITLRDARVGGTYVGNPAMTMTNGLLRGFITETDANNTMIPAGTPFVGGDPLSSVLPGGAGSCASHNAKDTHLGMSGWWLYLNYPATRVPWTD